MKSEEFKANGKPLNELRPSGSPARLGSVRDRVYNIETFEKCSIMFKVKEGENLNQRRHAVSALGVNTLSISRIRI